MALSGLFNRWINRKNDTDAEYIGDTIRVLGQLGRAPEACRRLAKALELEGDPTEIGDFVRQMAENESVRADADQKRQWAENLERQVR